MKKKELEEVKHQFRMWFCLGFIFGAVGCGTLIRIGVDNGFIVF